MAQQSHLQILTEDTEKFIKNLYVSVYIGFSHDLQKLKNNNVVQPVNEQLTVECYSATKRNKLMQHG